MMSREKSGLEIALLDFLKYSREIDSKGVNMDRKDELEPREGGVLHHDDRPGVGGEVGEAVGGVSGVVAGAAIGSAPS